MTVILKKNDMVKMFKQFSESREDFLDFLSAISEDDKIRADKFLWTEFFNSLGEICNDTETCLKIFNLIILNGDYRKFYNEKIDFLTSSFEAIKKSTEYSPEQIDFIFNIPEFDCFSIDYPEDYSIVVENRIFNEKEYFENGEERRKFLIFKQEKAEFVKLQKRISARFHQARINHEELSFLEETILNLVLLNMKPICPKK